MCFSAEASFGASAALLPVGAYCVMRSARGDRRFLPLGLAPIAFGVQQRFQIALQAGIVLLLLFSPSAFSSNPLSWSSERSLAACSLVNGCV